MSGKGLNDDLHVLISAAKNVPQRVGVCMRAYEALDNADSPAKLLAWFTVEAEEVWFQQEQNRLPAPSGFPELISMLEDHTDEDETESTMIDGLSVDPDDVEFYLPKYKGLIEGAIGFLSNNGYSEDEYYSKLWSALSALLAEKTDVEKGSGLYALLLDVRTPYHAVKRGLRMSNERYREVSGKIAPQLDELRFVTHLANSQKTETASQILDILDGLKTREDKIVFMSKVIGIDMPKGFKTIEISGGME